MRICNRLLLLDREVQAIADKECADLVRSINYFTERTEYFIDKGNYIEALEANHQVKLFELTRK